MGYYMTQQATKFLIKKENFGKALQAIRTLLIPGVGYSWVRDFSQAKTLVEALTAWRWDSFISEETGDLVDLTFNGEKLGDDETFFETLAPFVEKGSYIEMEGEDGGHWKWKFDGKTMTEVSGKVVYEDD